MWPDPSSHLSSTPILVSFSLSLSLCFTMKGCCPSFFRRRKTSYSYGIPLLLSNRVVSDEADSSIENAGHTPKRSHEYTEIIREESNRIDETDVDGFGTLHFTRLSCAERQFSWQVRTAIELEESIDPLLLTAIEMEDNEDIDINDDDNQSINSEEMHTAIEWADNSVANEKEERELEEESEMLMMTAMEHVKLDDNMVHDKIHESPSEKKCHSELGDHIKEEKEESINEQEKEELDRWRESIDGFVKHDETDGFGTGIAHLSKYAKRSLISPISTSIESSLIETSLHSIDLFTPTVQ